MLHELLKTCSLLLPIMVHVREGLPGTDELTIRHAFRMPSGYEIGEAANGGGCGSICSLINTSTFARYFTEQ